jgi:hypothetical protein
MFTYGFDFCELLLSEDNQFEYSFRSAGLLGLKSGLKEKKEKKIKKIDLISLFFEKKDYIEKDIEQKRIKDEEIKKIEDEEIKKMKIIILIIIIITI